MANYIQKGNTIDYVATDAIACRRCRRSRR